MPKYVPVEQGPHADRRTLTIRTDPSVIRSVEVLAGALNATPPYGAAGPWARAKVAELAMRRGIEALRAELAGSTSTPTTPATERAAEPPPAELPPAETIDRPRTALEALARLPVETVEALLDMVRAAAAPHERKRAQVEHLSAPAEDAAAGAASDKAPEASELGRNVALPGGTRARLSTPPADDEAPATRPDRRSPDRLAPGAWVREGERGAAHKVVEIGAGGIVELACKKQRDPRTLTRTRSGRICAECERRAGGRPSDWEAPKGRRGAAT